MRLAITLSAIEVDDRERVIRMVHAGERGNHQGLDVEVLCGDRAWRDLAADLVKASQLHEGSNGVIRVGGVDLIDEHSGRVLCTLYDPHEVKQTPKRTLADEVRDRFRYLYDACGGEDAAQHSDWIPGVVRDVAECTELDEDPEALAAYAYLEGVADALSLGIMGMLDKVLGEGAW